MEFNHSDHVVRIAAIRRGLSAGDVWQLKKPLVVGFAAEQIAGGWHGQARRGAQRSTGFARGGTSESLHTD